VPEADGDAAPVAKWEFWSLAVMLIAAHGDGAEAHAAAQLEVAADAGARVTWGEVVKLLPSVRLQQGTRE